MLAASTSAHSRSTRPKVAVAVVEQRQNRGQGVLGEKLLATEHDDEEADRVAEIGDQGSLAARLSRLESGPAEGGVG